MFRFLPLNGYQSRGWLNLVQSGGQSDSPTAQEKAKLRRQFRETRGRLSQEALAQGQPWGAMHIVQLKNFLSVALAAENPGARAQSWPKTVAAYWPIGSELNLLQNEATPQWRLPHAEPNGTLNWFAWSENVKTWPRDKKGLPIAPSDVEIQPYVDSSGGWLVLTPCLAVDAKGTRLGYGGGYYDRFLAMYGAKLLTAACIPRECYSETLLLPKEEHDIPVDLIVTESDVKIVSHEVFKKKLLLLSC
ncbi:5-formyltetrahydrofolate cyclo-ligase [bacterium]|nr:5-formyltetrahydrofolate cyclo-ligase [bacterium]